MTMEAELPQALETFVRDCVADGRYRDRADVLSSGLRLLQDQEARKKAFMTMLKETEAEAERDGYFTIDEVTAEIDEMLDAMEAEKAKATVE